VATSKHKKTANKAARTTAKSTSANRSAPSAAQKTAQKLSSKATTAQAKKPTKNAVSKKNAPAPSKPNPVKVAPPKAAPAKAPVVIKAPPAPVKAAPGKPGTPGAPVRGTPGQIIPSLSRTPARSPVGAEELKLKIGALYTATSQIKALKRSINKSFFEIGRILSDIQEKKLFEVKGYGSFEAFVEREIDLGKQLSLRLVRVTQVFVRDAAIAAGYERSLAALAAFDGETDVLSSSPSVSATSPSTGSTAGRQMLPPHKL
jgi:hypothetical protein